MSTYLQANYLTLLYICLALPIVQGHIWAWMLSIPYGHSEEAPLRPKNIESSSETPGTRVVCDHDRACGKGFSCDRHFGLCVVLKQAGQYCRGDAQCARGLSCMFGKCHHRVPEGQEGARCKLDSECGPSLCCARHHGEQVCKTKLMLGDSCYVPDGGLAFSINEICPCDEGLLCQSSTDAQHREKEFVYLPDSMSWTCQAAKP